MFLPTGAFVKGIFTDGLLSGNCYLRPNSEFAFLMRMTYGVLDGKTTVFDFVNDSVKVLNYTDGKYAGVEKDLQRSAEKCHKEITLTIFGREVGHCRLFSEMTTKVKKLPGNFFGSFCLSDKAWYYGAFKDGAPNGLGAIIEVGSKVQIGYFEDGYLSGFGRIIWPNGVVMDGIMKKSTINEDVIVYNQVAHNWVHAIFKDNILNEELSKDTGFPKQLRQQLFNKYFTLATNKRFNVDISPDIFTHEDVQEEVFYLVTGDRYTDTCMNNFRFKFSGEKKIEFDSRKDIEELRNNSRNDRSYEYGNTDEMIPVNTQARSKNLPPKAAPVKSKAIPIPPVATGMDVDGMHSFGDEAPSKDRLGLANNSRGRKSASKSKVSDTMSGMMSHGDARYARDVDFNIGEYDDSPDGFGPRQDDRGFQGGGTSGSKFTHYEMKTSTTKTHHNDSKSKSSQPQFDKYDLLIIQRALNWDNDKTLNTKNRASKRTQSTKAISEDTRLNIIKNYIEDFMENYMDRKTIDSLMNGIEGYSIVRNKHHV